MLFTPQKNLYVVTGIVTLLALVALVAYLYTHPFQKPWHTWTTIENTALGITLAYPSDLLVLEPGVADATTSLSLVYRGNATPNAYGIRIGTETTDAKDAASYFAQSDIQKPYPPTPITIGGVPAMELDEMAYADYSLYVVRDGKLYVIAINLPPAEADYVKKSIQFTGTPLVYTDGKTYSVGTYHASVVVNGLKSYSSARLGLSFNYPENFSLFEGRADTSPFDGYISISPEPFTSQALGRPYGGEGPPSMAFSFYRNTDHLALEDWIRKTNPGYSNYDPTEPTSHLTVTTVAGVPAFTYHTELGLYVTDYTAFLYKDWVVVFSVNDMGPQTTHDAQVVLSHLKLK